MIMKYLHSLKKWPVLSGMSGISVHEPSGCAIFRKDGNALLSSAIEIMLGGYGVAYHDVMILPIVHGRNASVSGSLDVEVTDLFTQARLDMLRFKEACSVSRAYLSTEGAIKDMIGNDVLEACIPPYFTPHGDANVGVFCAFTFSTSMSFPKSNDVTRFCVSIFSQMVMAVFSQKRSMVIKHGNMGSLFQGHSLLFGFHNHILMTTDQQWIVIKMYLIWLATYYVITHGSIPRDYLPQTDITVNAADESESVTNRILQDCAISFGYRLVTGVNPPLRTGGFSKYGLTDYPITAASSGPMLDGVKRALIAQIRRSLQPQIDVAASMSVPTALWLSVGTPSMAHVFNAPESSRLVGSANHDIMDSFFRWASLSNEINGKPQDEDSLLKLLDLFRGVFIRSEDVGFLYRHIVSVRVGRAEDSLLTAVSMSRSLYEYQRMSPNVRRSNQISSAARFIISTVVTDLHNLGQVVSRFGLDTIRSRTTRISDPNHVELQLRIVRSSIYFVAFQNSIAEKIGSLSLCDENVENNIEVTANSAARIMISRQLCEALQISPSSDGGGTSDLFYSGVHSHYPNSKWFYENASLVVSYSNTVSLRAIGQYISTHSNDALTSLTQLITFS
jgi:hypothetical protein